MTELDTAAQSRINERIALLIGAKRAQVQAAVDLLDEGATVPFIARYRKEATGGLDDTQLRNLQEALVYGREMEERRAAVIASVTEQGKLKPRTANSELKICTCLLNRSAVRVRRLRLLQGWRLWRISSLRILR